MTDRAHVLTYRSVATASLVLHTTRNMGKNDRNEHIYTNSINLGYKWALGGIHGYF